MIFLLKFIRHDLITMLFDLFNIRAWQLSLQQWCLENRLKLVLVLLMHLLIQDVLYKLLYEFFNFPIKLSFFFDITILKDNKTGGYIKTKILMYTMMRTLLVAF